MAIADTITSMQNHTSNAYTMIGYGTDLTGINKNLENLSPSIFNAFLEALRTPDTLFTNLPKKSGTGAVISLNDTANAPMRIELNASELSQDGTPTPSSPQAVHTISGSNKVVVCGKNLFDKEAITNDYYYDDSGNYTSVQNTYLSDFIQVNSNTNYTYQLTQSGDTSNKRINYFDSNKTWISQSATTNNTHTFTTPNNAKYIRISFNIMVDKNSIMIELGNTATSYEPYISQEADIDLGDIEYCKIGNYEDKFIRTSGKNKLDNSKIVKGRLDNGVIGYESDTTALTYTDNSISFTTNTNYRGVVSDFIPIEASDYIFFAWGSATTSPACAVNYYDENKTFISANSGYSLTNALRYSNAVANAKYIRLYISLNTAGTQTITYPQVRFDSDIPDYEPYGSNEWYIKKNIGKVTNNSVSYSSSDETTNITYFRIPKPVNYNGYNSYDRTENNKVLYNKALYSTSGSWNSTDNIGKILSGGVLNYLMIGFTKGTILETATTELANDILYYPLATPTYTQITGTLETQLENVYQKMLSYTGVTNISQVNNDLAFNLSASAIEGV